MFRFPFIIDFGEFAGIRLSFFLCRGFVPAGSQRESGAIAHAAPLLRLGISERPYLPDMDSCPGLLPTDSSDTAS